MFKDKLKELREKAGISQYELAEKIFVSRSAVAKWENGLGMPGKESLELLCNFFNISKEEILKEDDPLIVIDNVQKKSNKIIKLLILVICFIVVVYTCIFIGVMIQKRQEDLTTPQNGMFYSEKYLEEFELDDLEMIPGNDYLLMGKRGTAFYSYIDSYETFDEYAKYVYDKLQYSTSISYLSFQKELYDHNQPLSNETDYYLFPSNNLSDHITKTFTNGKVQVYSFYYVTNLDKDRNLKEPVNVNHIELQFLLGSEYKETNSNWFKMVIENDDNNNITPNLYLANEFYSIEEIVLNNENLSEYININVSSDGLSIGFYAVGEYSSNPVKPDSIPPFQLFLNLNIELRDKETNEIVKNISKYILAEESTRITINSKDLNVESLYNYEVVFSYDVLERSTFYKINKK